MITQNDIIAVLIEDPKYIKSNLKLQKTLFIIFGYLAKNYRELVDVDTFNFQRWMYGPVNVNLYNEWRYKKKLNDIYTSNIKSREREIVEAYKERLDNVDVWKLIDFTQELNSVKSKEDFEDLDNNKIIEDFKNK